MLGIRGRAAGGAAVVERAPLVIGADGRHSLVARAVQAAEYHVGPPLEAGYRAYYSGVPTEAFEVYIRPYGPGWALVGDAGYHKDPGTAQGISDAFRDAELLAGAFEQWCRGDQTFEQAMSGYQHARDTAVLPMYELTCELASLEPPPPDLAQLLGTTAGNQPAMDAFASMIAGTMPVQEFFAPGHQRRILAQAGLTPQTA
jgi:2-polyprenyl-6-methoxyphenol hydroxylase-like FAD-dependent oxidoreductase